MREVPCLANPPFSPHRSSSFVILNLPQISGHTRVGHLTHQWAIPSPPPPVGQVDGVPRQTAKSELGTPVQDYLQEHFIAAMVQVAEALRDEPNVVGFDTLNGPGGGWMGLHGGGWRA